MVRVEVVVSRGAGLWIGRGDGLAVDAADIAELDERIVSALAESGRFPQGTRVEAFVACDREVIPAWMRPYHSHYFNRTISFTVGEENHDEKQRQ